MTDFNNYKKITQKYLKETYNLSQKQFDNIRRRTGERIQNAKALYLWKNDDIPSVNQLIDYQLRRRKSDVSLFELILQTPSGSKISNVARKRAVEYYSGTLGGFNQGFYTFSKGIKQFIVMRENALKILNGKNDIEKLEHFRVGERLSDTENYYITNNKYGRDSVNQLNNVIDEYNLTITNVTKNNAVQHYVTFVKRLMNLIHFAEEHDAMAGS